jgi:signal transduction histidine kinase
VRITIGDTGIGIPPDQIGNIFQLFTQLRGSQSTAAKGLGMGLALVRRLAELHGGTVEVVSVGPGQGSQFTVRLPINGESSVSISNQTKPALNLRSKQLWADVFLWSKTMTISPKVWARF